MGVTGLWRLIEPSGKPTPLETLENKVLAVDISIWLHQAIKGFQDVRGAPLPNAHLLGIYHRVCKLLYYRIKPVFIFDGGVPNLKKETIAKRNQLKSKKLNEADRIQKQLLNTILKHSAVSKVISEKTKACIAPKETTEDMYKLPSSNFDTTLSSDEEDTSKSSSSSPVKQWDLHTIDEKSPYFKSLPADVRHEILTDLKETRKQSSWGRLHELPKQSDDFAGFQMKRLLKRYSVQVSLEEAEKEMGGKTLSLSELEALLKDQGVVASNDTVGARIASDEHTRYVLIKNVQKAMDKDKRLNNIEEEKGQPVIVDEINEQRIAEEVEEINEQKIAEKVEEINEQRIAEEVKEINEQRIAEKVEEINEQRIAEEVEEINEQRIAEEVAESKIVEEQSKILTNNGDIEFQNDLQRAIQLSLQDVPSTSKQSNDNEFSISFLDANISRSSESEEECNARNLDALSSAKNYMTEYSGLTPNEVAKIIGSNLGLVKKNNGNNIKSLNTLNNIEKTKELHCEEISSTSRSPLDLVSNDKSKEQKKEAVIINEVEVMSDSSDSSIEFLDVKDNQGAVKETKQLEIVIKPEDALEDDIFEDIFTKEANPTTTTAKAKINSSEQVSSSTDANDERNKETQEVLIQEPAKSIVAEFIKETNDATSKVEDRTVLTTEQLQKMEEDLRLETAELISERLSKERMANNLTDQIYQEVQELLQLFGVPYIVAPMEAEAQCAFLDEVNLTDGTITDDSDIWLFGGKTVYKNFFNQQKHVMKFQLESIQCHFKLTREQMILLALLVGSDYTNGLQGVGPVTALEILAAFPPSKTAESQLTYEPLISGLQTFQKWLSGGLNVGLAKNTLRSKLKNVLITESFPSLQVVKAYLEPTIDSSEESFSWAKPDIPGLIEFAKRKFGWPQVKSEAILKPVLKRMNESHLQKTIKEYFQTKRKIDGNIDESKMSKRVKKAIARIGVKRGSSSEDDVTSTNKRKPKSKRNSKNLKSKKTLENITNEVHGLSSDEDVNVLIKTCSQSEDRLEQINSEIKHNIKQQEQQMKKVRSTIDLHKKDSIPQKEQDKIDALRSKMKAIEVFRKSKKGPGYVKKRKVISRQLKEDAGLSNDSSSD